MWMFGSRTTVKKVRNSLTWFSQESLCRREETTKSSFPLSESIVFHLVYWMSSFLSCLVHVCVWCFVSAFGRRLTFCISPVLSQSEKVDHYKTF